MAQLPHVGYGSSSNLWRYAVRALAFIPAPAGDETNTLRKTKGPGYCPGLIIFQAQSNTNSRGLGSENFGYFAVANHWDEAAESGSEPLFQSGALLNGFGRGGVIFIDL
jgi:hypothetical protein